MTNDEGRVEKGTGGSTVVLYVAASLDGFIARRDGDVSWLDAYQSPDFGYERFLEGAGSVVMGSRTYEKIPSLGDWPYGTRKTYVATGRELQTMAGASIEFTGDELPEVIRKAKEAAGGKAVYVVGGGRLTTSLLSQGLLDEISLFVIPTILGEGIPLFNGVSAPLAARFVQSIPYRNGVVLLQYGVNR